MKSALLFFFFLLSFGCLRAQIYSDSISINFFLLDECRISQNISGEINKVHRLYRHEQFHYQSYFPNKSSTVSKIESFLKEYHIKIPYFTDYKKNKTQFYGAKIAPEVVVYDEKKQKLIYRGRINNSYYKVGRRRGVTTKFDLRDVLEDILNQKEIKTKETPAIGCVINQ